MQRGSALRGWQLFHASQKMHKGIAMATQNFLLIPTKIDPHREAALCKDILSLTDKNLFLHCMNCVGVSLCVTNYLFGLKIDSSVH